MRKQRHTKGWAVLCCGYTHTNTHTRMRTYKHTPTKLHTCGADKQNRLCCRHTHARAHTHGHTHKNIPVGPTSRIGCAVDTAASSRNVYLCRGGSMYEGDERNAVAALAVPDQAEVAVIRMRMIEGN